MYVEAWLPRAAARRPGAVALDGQQGALTYAELLGAARSAAGGLAARGAVEGATVGLALPPGRDFAAALHACWLLRATAVPLDPRLADAERDERAAGCSLVVAPGALPEGERAPVPAEQEPAAVATRMHTSGSTAAPRPVDLTFANWQAHAAASALALGLDTEERWLCALPLSHVGGLSILVRSAVYGTAAVLHERFDAEAATAVLMDGGATLVSLVPTMLARMLDAGLERPPALRCALIGGAPLAPALAARAAAAGVPVAQTYGLTEACSQVATSAPGEPGTAGQPLPGTRVEIAQNGEIIVSGPTVAPGAAGPDGRLRTGDLGHLDERGRLVVTGRIADTIVTGGENVAPAEVEAALISHPDVADAAVLGVPDPEWGEAVRALVVMRDGATLDPGALRDHCAARLGRFKVPKAFGAVPALPRTAAGKLRRPELRRISGGAR